MLRYIVVSLAALCIGMVYVLIAELLIIGNADGFCILLAGVVWFTLVPPSLALRAGEI